jgi:phenylacetate-CoA ligase
VTLSGLKIGLVGPLPPPAGGMANQTRQLAELLEREGANVTIVQTNSPYRPRFIAPFRGLRGLFRFVPYAVRLWRVSGQVKIVHVMANSGWSWHLCAAPAIWIAHWRRVPVVVNYRGGEAGTFLARAGGGVRRTLRLATALIVPSGFLKEVFAGHGLPAGIVPNIIDLERFHPAQVAERPATRHLVVARNLEPIYDIPTALHAFALIRKSLPDVRLTVAGSGPERTALEALCRELRIAESVHFCGTRDREQMATLYRTATVVLNPSLVDNMPNSVLEAMASGVPVVSTNVGGVPFIVRDDVTGLLVPPGNPQAMAAAVLRVIGEPELARRVAAAATLDVQQYAWACVRQRWTDVYGDAIACGRGAGASSRPGAARAGFYTRVVSESIFPLHERLKGHSTVAVRNALEASQWWPPERLSAAQFAGLAALLLHANDCVPYYRDLFRSIGFDPRAMTTLADLERLPFLTKADIRAHTESLKSTATTGLARSNTGGSSGEPLVFFLGKERVSHDVAAKWRATRWWGVDIGDREIVVWGSPIELHAQDLVRRLRDHLLRTRLLPAFEMSDARLDEFVAAIRDVRPSMLFGYPSALARIARHAAAKGVPLDTLGIKVAFVTSERLYDDQRTAIESGFGCPVANGYGGRDAGFIAHACPQGGMHITAEDIIVETIGADGRPVGAGAPGEIVVTHLASRDFPFIRYRTGDFGVLDTRMCECGRGLPLLREIQGRSTDFVVAANGTLMHGLALIYVIRDLEGVNAFKIIQESRTLTRVQIVPGERFGPGTRDAIAQGLRARLGPQVDVTVEEVAAIAPEASGKYRYVVSKIAT